MEVPDLLRQRLDEEPRGGVALDGDDMAVFTRNRTFIYRGKRLLSDATVEVYGHDVEALSVSQGRNETTFRLTSVGDTEQFAVANRHAEAVLEGLFEGILAAADVLEEGETVRGIYLFSDLTVVVADGRLVKHVGTAVWDDDYEVFPFAEVTGLEFEEGDVATQVVLRVGKRAERIKAPSDEAPVLQRTLTRALCEFHGVDSLEQFNDGTPRAESSEASPSAMLEEGLTPLIESTEKSVTSAPDDGWSELDPVGTGDPADGERVPGTGERGDTGDEPPTGTDSADPTANGASERGDGTRDDVDALERRVRELARAIDRQNELLERQTRRLSELAERVDTEE